MYLKVSNMTQRNIQLDERYICKALSSLFIPVTQVYDKLQTRLENLERIGQIKTFLVEDNAYRPQSYSVVQPKQTVIEEPKVMENTISYSTTVMVSGVQTTSSTTEPPKEGEEVEQEEQITTTTQKTTKKGKK